MSTQIATFAFNKLEPAQRPDRARKAAVEMGASLTLAAGTLVGQVTATGKHIAYASGNSDGSQVPVGPLVFDIVTDANGNVVLGPNGTVQDLLHGADRTAEIYKSGDFYESDLTGLDANAVTVLRAREIGIGTSKIVSIPLG